MERKKFLAVVMAVLMALTLLPSMVFAAESPSGELGGKLKIKGLAAEGTDTGWYREELYSNTG